MDKAKRTALLEQCAAAPQAVAEAVKTYPEASWDYRAAPDEWTIRETANHLAESEAVGLMRSRQAIAEPGSDVRGYDEKAWTAKLHYDRRSAVDAAALFGLLRESTAELLEQLTEAEWDQSWYTHSEHGKQTLEDWLERYVNHAAGHMAQMQEVYEAWEKQAPK